MRFKNAILAAAALAALLGHGTADAGSMNIEGAKTQQECVRNGCHNTAVAFSGTLVVNADANADLATMAANGDVVGSAAGSFGLSVWGPFSIATYSGGVFDGSGAYLRLAKNDSGLCGTGVYLAKFDPRSILYSKMWGDMGFSLSGSYFCFQDPALPLVLRVVSPELGAFDTINDGSNSSAITTANGPTLGISFNGLGVLSDNAQGIVGITSRLEANYGSDPYLYGTQALATVGTSLTKYDFNVDTNRNVEKVTANLVPWSHGTSFPIGLGWRTSTGWVNSISLSNSGFYNQDLQGSTGAAAATQTVWFDLENDTCTAVDGNSGCNLRVNGGISAPAFTDAAALNGFTNTKVDGKKTVIIEGGNLYIDSDMYYGNPASDMVVFVVRRSRTDPTKGGNVYVDPRVTNLVGSFIIDGALMNYDGSSIVTDPALLRRQLYLFGSIASANSIGGSTMATPSCPYGTDAEKQGLACTQAEAAKYDLAALRTFRLRQSVLGPWQTDPSDTLKCDISSGNEKTVPVASDAYAYDETLYAWAGKKKCYADDPAETSLGTTDKSNPVVIEFNPALTTADLPILRKNDF